MTREGMNRILLGTALAAIAGGVIYYLNHREEVDDRVSNLKSKAADAIDKAKTKLRHRADEASARVNR